MIARRQAFVLVAALAGVLVLCGVAAADNYSYRRNAVDDALAARVNVRGSDVPSQLKLAGGRVKPDESSDTTGCNGRKQKESDLVVTGDASTRYSNKAGGVAVLEAETMLFKTRAMAATDVARGRPFLTKTCFLQALQSDHPDPKSFESLGHAKCTCDFSASFLFETTQGTPTARLLWVLTLLQRDRGESYLLTGVYEEAGKKATAERAALIIQGDALKAMAPRLSALG